MSRRLPALPAWSLRRREPSLAGLPSAFGSGAPGRRLATLQREREAAHAERQPRRWAFWGALLGGLLTLVAFAPARWLADAVASASRDQVQLADARGTVWSGDAVLVLGAGAGSRDARALPGRLGWTLRPTLLDGLGLALNLRQDCCIQGTAEVRVQPGWGRVAVRVQGLDDPGSRSPGAAAPEPDGSRWIAQWPAAWLVGLGTPWNTLQPGGALRLGTQGLKLEWAAGRFSMEGQAVLELRDFSSRLATLPRLGSYRIAISADPAQAGTAQVGLSTLDGALLLSGQGSWSASGLRLRGEASAAEADQAALSNLLNIIGRRDGARSVLTIG
ncbi:type II secretion system protein N [Leptothrix discophora]|uniref:Type II secretion system protein N n=1 Tax=Leptothrix discophora TaxID=89 RepID=A0ABT9G5Z7_LEPDI|nr:type II secretion system protein N [Leptothrix discophora]MDP4301911.1 type II secretion system protein N [Leptothrix discophora]